MSFKDYDKKTFIADTARDFATRRISKRAFLRKMALAGVGFSAFNAGLLGTGHQRGKGLIISSAEAQTPEEMTKWLKDVGAPFKGSEGSLHLGSNPADRRSQPDQERVHRADRHRSRNRNRSARAGSRQGHPGRPGPARHL